MKDIKNKNYEVQITTSLDSGIYEPYTKKEMIERIARLINQADNEEVINIKIFN